ncbi:hypothetical protein BYT27DRAFT_7265512 [Phlegmacium glaucopus]|nr:hypothetical protein BYT27DRAFT_7265512 [Phlegmacium glaucopus]
MVDKPLPELPTPALTTLSVEARNHRARLIQHFFSDIHEPRIESRRDGWLHALEKALDGLSQHFSRGDWLSSIRRGRELKHRTLSSPTVTNGDHNEGNQRDKPLPESPDEPLKKLKLLNNRSASPSTEPREGHLVLCLSPHQSRAPIATEDSDFDIIPANIGCIFSEGSFSLQPGESDSTILYGLDGLRDFNVEESNNIRLVGGTFTFKGVDSPVHHMLLSKVLRLSIYVHLSLLLEQYLLSDSRVPINFPRPRPSMPTHSPSAPVKIQPTEPKPRSRNSIFPSSFVNVFLRRSLSLRPKTNKSGGTISDTPVEAAPRRSFEGRLRFSFIGEKRPSTQRPTQIPPRKPFETTLHRVEESVGLLSTSTGVMFKPPQILVDLAEREKATQSRLLMADERTALSGLLGWDGKDAEGRGMSGILGFVRYQALSVLHSQHIPPLPPESSSAFTISSSTSPNPSTTGLSPCGNPRWTTYCYYSSGDRLLGDMINDWARNVDLPCERPGCPFTRGQHENRIIHGGIKIVIQTSSEVEDSVDNVIQMWQSCAVCEARTQRTNMHDGTFLFSFAKFLELLVYSPTICTLKAFLCDHTTPPHQVSPDLPAARLNIIRHFTTASRDVSFALSTTEDIFELKVPRLQIRRGTEKASVPQTLKEERAEDEASQKKELRREIKKWWEGVADHIDKIERVLEREDTVLIQKSLPRLPSTDDAYDVFHHSSTPTESHTPTPSTPQGSSTIPYTPSSEPANANAEGTNSTIETITTSEFSTVSNATTNESSPESNTSPVPTASTVSSTSTSTTIPPMPSTISTNTSTFQPPTPLKDNSEQLLTALRHNFHQIEQSLYTQLAKTPDDSLNEVRSTFLSTGRGTQKRLKAWQKKHLGPKAKLLGELVAEEPMWWGKECHVVPGANIIVREDDWGSIIAHTLSTPDYHLELVNISTTRSSSGSHPSTPLASPLQHTPSSSFFSVATGYKLFSSGSRNQPDPDQEGVVWNEPEQYYSVISRKEPSRDHVSRLGMRDILRQKSHSGTSSNGVATPPIRSLSISSTQVISPTTKADVTITPKAAEGKVSGGSDTLDTVEPPVLQELSSVTTPRPSSDKASTVISVAPDPQLQIESEKAPSVISVESEGGESEETARQDKGQDNIALTTLSPPPLPPKEFAQKEKTVEDPSSTIQSKTPETVPPTSSSFASALAHGINSAVRFVINAESSATVSPSSSNVKHHALLLADITSIDERPHIKYDWTIGKRLKFSCTVYYAKQFDALRRRCGINDLFLKSLARSTNWTAQGGKSKSNFWKTNDGRFIIKSLVNAWNVADLQVLIELAPSYFRYMDSTASKATVLAKLIGFYTIEIKNLETGTIQSKADLLVMENLFHDRNITKTFDLKGIQGRKVKAHGNASKTLFDGEWIEGQQRTPMLVQPHSKIILRDAIKCDTEFLSKSNIMDYSLLLGVDEEKRQIACGLVDTIGSYTFAKTLEYKAKQGLQSGKEVTVVPPAEYRDRFVSALEGYFIACPDKWSKPLDEAKIISDPNLLPSVL